MIDLLGEVAERGFGSAAFLTYGADLDFFERKVMGRLRDSGCRNIIVVADGHQLKDALNSAAELRYVGVQYALVPVRLGNQAFHPKAILLVGEEQLKVLIGSGNLTLPGYTRNWEIFTRSVGEDAAGLALDLLRVFEGAASRSALGEAFAGWRRRLESYSPWLFNTKANLGSVTLLSSADGPILPRVAELLRGREVSRLLVVSPFFDREAAALKWLVDHLRPKDLRLLATDGVQLDPAHVEATLASADTGRILEFLGNGRPLHGKALLFEGPWGEALLAGSPNLSSAALLRKAGARGNFELATFQEGKAGDYSSLFEDKIGPRVAVADLHPRKPIARSNRVAPLELEAVWVQEGRLHAVPAGRDEKLDTIEVRLERRGAETARHHLRRGSEGKYTVELGQEELTRLEGAPLRACWIGSDDQLGAAVWIQNLDAVKRRANPVQRPRYAGGLQGLSRDSLGLDEDAWNNLFDAFLALSKGWGEYAKSFRPEKALTAKRTSKSGKVKDQQTWDPESFYVTLDDVRIELPAYFARVDNSGWGIGDFEYLISALPTARLVPAEAPLGTPEQNEGRKAEDDEDEAGNEVQRRKIGNRLFKKFIRLVEAYEESVKQPTQDKAEATLVCSLYTALHVAFARAVTARILDASRFRELVPWLTHCWIAEVWAPMSSELHDEIEESTGCATISLAAIAAATSPWAREHMEDQGEYDADMFTELAGAMREMRAFFLSLKADFEVGNIRARWTKAADEYDQLGLERVTPLSRFEDLERRYEIWRLDERSGLQRELKNLGLHETAVLEDGVLRIHAPLPDSMRRRKHLQKLLYLIHEAVDRRAAVVWMNSQNHDTIRKIALVLNPEQKAVLEVTRYASGAFLFWRHSASSGTPTGGVNLMQSRSIPSAQLRLPNRASSDATLIDRARDLVPDLWCSRDDRDSADS